MNWILGGWSTVTAVGGHFSRLAIETDDAYCLMMKTKRCQSVLIQLNYIDHTGHRAMIFNSDELTIKVDLIHHWIEVNGKRQVQKVERDDTYREEHRAVLGKRWKELCSYGEAMDVMRLIEASEKASRKAKWVEK
jgi:predicted dehydrogenase